jgi:acyl carrier protein
MKKKKKKIIETIPVRIFIYLVSILIIIGFGNYIWMLFTQPDYVQGMPFIGLAIAFLCAVVYLVTDIMIIVKKKKGATKSLSNGQQPEPDEMESEKPRSNEGDLIRENGQRAGNAVILIWIVMTLEIVSLVSGYLQYSLLQTIANGGDITQEATAANDNREQTIAGLYLIAYIISVITFILWFRRAYRNLHQMTDNLSWSEGWAAGGWFVPFVNLYRPYQIMNEMYRKTKEILTKKKLVSSEKLQTDVLGWWWTLWIVNGVLGQIAFRYSTKAETVEQLITGTLIGMTGNILGIILAIITVKVIKNYAATETLLKRVAANEKTEGFSQKKVLSQREEEDIRQRVFAVISKQLNLTCPLNEEMTFHSLQADLVDLVEIAIKIGKEFGIAVPYESAHIDNAGPATRRFFEKHNIGGKGSDIVDVGNIGIVVDMVVELVNAKQNESMAAKENTAKENTKDLQWSFAEGVLTIKGKGDMQSFDSYIDYPWCNLKSSTTEIIIENGVTSIGQCAFQGFTKVTQVTIADSVRKIERLAFGYCVILEKITVPESVTSLGKRAFANCSSLKAFIIPKSVTFVGPDLLDMMPPCNLEYIVVQWDEPASLDHFDSNESIGPVMSTVLLAPRGSKEKYREAGWRWMLIFEYDMSMLFDLKQSGMDDYFVCRILHGYEIKRQRGDYN